MNYLFGLFLLLGTAGIAKGQYRLVVHVSDSSSGEPLPGATVVLAGSHQGDVTGLQGFAHLGPVAKGNYQIRVSCIGYRARGLNRELPGTSGDTLEVSLTALSEGISPIVISTTRIPELTANTPVHIDVIGSEDMEEGTAMSPSNLVELLSELSGTQVQQTSSVSGNMSIRLQGLDGRYTQWLADGFPLYGGFSGSLNVLQTPPLDLKQVEIIKGAGSALYGGDAISGIINLISKTPDSVLDAEGVLNQTDRGETDFSGYYGKRNGKTGWTFLVSAARLQPRDINKDGFSDIPRVRQLTLHPSFYWYPDRRTTLSLGINYSLEQRQGGDMLALTKGPDSLHDFLETNKTRRDFSQLTLTRRLKRGQVFTFKNSVAYFNRSISVPGQSLNGIQWSSYWEADLMSGRGRHRDLAGMDFNSDRFLPGRDKSLADLAYRHQSLGFFVQDDWNTGNKTVLETGVRTDFSRGVFPLPRAAFLYQLSPSISLRVGGGLGYKIPNIFNAGSEEQAYGKVYPISPSVHAEESSSASFSIHYQGSLGRLISLQLDQDFYETLLDHALIANPDSLAGGSQYFMNAPGPVISRGFETNAQFSLEDWSLNLSYTFTDARQIYLPGDPLLPLSPRGKFLSSLLYEQDGFLTAGVEAFYTGHQILGDGSLTPDYWTFDFMVEKSMGPFTLLLNIENFTDTRQSRFGALYSGTIQKPQFQEVFAPLVGRVANLSLKIDWGQGSGKD